MSTARDICDSALRRLRVVAAGETMSAEDAQHTLRTLNAMMHGWAALGVNCAHQDFALNSTFRFFVPPAGVLGSTLAVLDYRGNWDASTNAPTLATGVGTAGHLYVVSVAGSTALDGITSWSIGDYLTLDQRAWRKGRSHARHEGAVIDLLAVAVADDFGKTLGPSVAKGAADGWIGLQAEYVRVDTAVADTALLAMPTRRRYGMLESG